MVTVMSANLHKLVPKQVQQAAMRAVILTDVILAERLHAVDQAQIALDESWDRVMMSSEGGEPDQMAVLDYEMAINDLLEAKAKAGL